MWDEWACDHEVHIHQAHELCKSGGCVRKAVEFTLGDLPFAMESWLGLG